MIQYTISIEETKKPGAKILVDCSQHEPTPSEIAIALLFNRAFQGVARYMEEKARTGTQAKLEDMDDLVKKSIENLNVMWGGDHGSN